MLEFAASRNRQIEIWLETLLDHENAAETARIAAALKPKEGLSAVAEAFDVDGRQVRHRRLALDLAAILRLHAFLQREQAALAGATVAATAKKVTAWVAAVEQLRRTIDTFGRTANQNLAGSASSLAALEIILEAVTAEAIDAAAVIRKKENNGKEISNTERRMLESGIRWPVNAVLGEARWSLLSGNLPNALPLDRIEEAATEPTPPKVLASRPIFEGPDDDIDDIDIPNPQVDSYHEDLALVRRAISLTRRHSETEMTMVKAANRLKMAADRLTKSDGAKQLVPSAEEALVYGLTLLVDGWRPRIVLKSGLGRPMSISDHTRSHVAKLAKDIGTAMGFHTAEGKGDDDRAFGRTAVGAAEAFKSRGRERHVFTDRRTTGIEKREFRPDRYDRITPEQAAILERLQMPVPEGVVIQRQRIVHRLQWQQP